MAAGAAARLGRPTPRYAELHAHSDHSLLDGVVPPEELVIRAAELGIEALALTDHDALYGAVRFTQAACEAGIKPLLGAEMTLNDGTHLTLLVESAPGYANLCQLITQARAGQEKSIARLPKSALAGRVAGLIGLSGCRRGQIPRLLLAGRFDRAVEVARGYARLFGSGRFFIELQRHYRLGDVRLLAGAITLAARAGLEVVATGNVHYLYPEQHEVHDVLTCTRHHTTLEEAGSLLRPNAEYRLRSPQEMAELFSSAPEALENALRIAERCAPADAYLPSGPQVLPRFPVIGGRSAAYYLGELCETELARRYPHHPPRELLARELAVIQELDLADYFLTVWDIVRFSRSRGIRCQGRGSAANSLVAFLLNISPIDPVSCDLVFERFLSRERHGPPDIDVDFAADRREEVIQYVYGKYGRDHAAMACTLSTYRARSAVRDTARALGFPRDLINRLAKELDVGSARSVAESRGLVESFGLDLAKGPYRHLLRIAPQLEGIPRHLGIHNGGMIISGRPLCHAIPVEPATMPDRTVVQWDKEALETAGIPKIDLLGLRMLSAIEDAVDVIEAQTGQRLRIERITPDDPEVYGMLCEGKTVGVFQVESQAQASLIPRFQPRSFEDLVVEISLIRPGPIQGNMVSPYLRRRQGLDPVTYAHPLLEEALGETLGVIVFQEQVLKVARDLAGFAPGRAELLRRALSHKRAAEKVAQFHDAFIAGARARGVSETVAEGVFDQLRAFGGYAFAKSHAAAFALLTYQSAWLRRYRPVAFFAGLLRHQPMGFYPPHVIVSEARRCGVEIRAVNVEQSDVLAAAQGDGLRLGLAMVSGLGEAGGQRVVESRRFGPFRSLADFCRRTRLGRRAVEGLIWAGAFDHWGIPRRQLFWDLQAALDEGARPPTLDLPPREQPAFGSLSPSHRLWAEVAYTGASSGAHLVSLVREALEKQGATPSTALAELPAGSEVTVGGVLVSRQRPPTAGGTVFLALEDEAGIANVIVRPAVYETYRTALKAQFVAIRGRVQRQGKGVSVVAEQVIALAPQD